MKSSKAPLFPHRPAFSGTLAAAAAGRGSDVRSRLLAGGAILFALIGAAGMQPALLGDHFLSLDSMAKQPAPKANQIESPTETFTGSAFFFAQDAFAPSPEVVAGSDNPHVWTLRKVDSAMATPFTGQAPLDRYRALNCLTSAIYYEAGNEPDEGQQAVAQVVLNRVRHPAWPNSVCAVVYQGAERTDMLCQFTFSCDGAMARMPVADKWARARRVAEAALAGHSYAPVGLSTFYHTLAVRPGWSTRLDPVAVVGAHIFYQMRGADGTGAAFRTPYSGRELISGPPPRVWKPIPAGAIPDAMPFLLPTENAGGKAVFAISATPATVSPSVPPTQGWTEWKQPTPAPGTDGGALPQSGIRPEYRDSGKPLI